VVTVSPMRPVGEYQRTDCGSGSISELAGQKEHMKLDGSRLGSCVLSSLALGLMFILN
jgi:hypothetical protein